MKYQIFSREQREVLTTANTMLETILNESKNEFIRVNKEEDDAYKMANELEDKLGVDDTIAQAQWRVWSHKMDDKQALRDRINELEDAMRFNERLLANV